MIKYRRFGNFPNGDWTLKKQRKTKAKKLPLKPEELELIYQILDKLNILLLKDVLQIITTGIAEEFEARLKIRLKKDGSEFIPTEQKMENLELNNQFFHDFCRLLQNFIYLKGLGVDWDKRQAEQLLRSIESLETQEIGLMKKNSRKS